MFISETVFNLSKSHTNNVKVYIINVLFVKFADLCARNCTSY